MHKCKICGIDIKNSLGLASHIRHKHAEIKNTEEYYLINNERGTCKVCGKPTTFINGIKGYRIYCSQKCANIDPDIREKVINRNREKYGTDYATQSEKVKQKTKNTNLEKYCVESYLQTEDAREKCKKEIWSEKAKSKRQKTNLEKYGSNYVVQSDYFDKKVKKSNLAKYGVENVFASEEIKDKIKETNLDRFGVENAAQAAIVKSKIKETVVKNNGGMGFASISIKEKSELTRKQNIKKFCTKNKLVRLKNLDLFAPYQCLKKLQIEPVKKYYCIFVSENDAEKLLKFSKELKTTNISNFESEVLDFVKTIKDDKIVERSRKIIKPFELDIYIPNKKLAIECNGVYWHSTNTGTAKDYHYTKTKMCNKLGIRLIHINDWEWTNKREICESIIKSALGIYKERIFARKCKIKDVNSKDANKFLEINHIQGEVNSTVRLGLYYNDELVQIATFGKSRYKTEETELLRMCTKLDTIVVGGFSRLLAHTNFDNLISYVDLSKFTGNSYLQNGFEPITFTRPNYYYYKNGIRISRIAAQKHKLAQFLNTFDENKSETANMIDNGWSQVFDSGNLKLTLKGEK